MIPLVVDWKYAQVTTYLTRQSHHSYTPTVAQQFFEVAKTMYGDTTVKARNRELAIMGLCSILDVPYVVYCHRPLAVKYGLSNEQYEEGLAGNVPSGLTEEERMAYSLGRILTDLKGPLDDATWQDAVSKMGKAEIVGIVHTVAGYRWVSLLDHVNGEDRRWEGRQS